MKKWFLYKRLGKEEIEMSMVAVTSETEALFVEFDSFLQTEYPKLLDHLRGTQGFPGVCYTASQIVASFFQVAYGREVSIVCGTFGSNQLFHTWMNVGGNIIDLTLFQFHQDRLSKKEYEKMPINKLIGHIQECQQGFIFGEEDHPTFSFYQELVRVKPEFLDCGQQGVCFDDFLKQALQSDAYRYSDWFHSVVTPTGERFKNWLTAHGKRVTKRFFTKYAIVNESR